MDDHAGVAEPAQIDAVVVGAGFAGLYALYRLRAMGLSVRVFEAGDGVGGTWYWNRYPGARCDIESVDYSYSFSPELEQEWEWTERYPSQPELLRYLNHVADRFELRPHITLSTRVRAAEFDGDRWLVSTDYEQLRARFVIMATGCLSDARTPDLPGLADFTGSAFHTARWPEPEPDLTDRRVGVIGTGSSGVQVIPMLAERAGHVHVFQRTPAYSLPARNRALPADELAAIKSTYPERRAHSRRTIGGTVGLSHEVSQNPTLSVNPDLRRAEYARRWSYGGQAMVGAFVDLLTDPAANECAATFIRDRIAETVRNPDVAEALTPRDYPFAAKRPCIDTNYYDTYNRDDVTLVDLRAEPLRTITPTGIATTRAEYDLDTLVLATGFDAYTGALARIHIAGRDGVTLADKWAGGPRAYLGCTLAGFPNLFLVTGPGSPSVLTNMVLAIEQHIDWIADLLTHMDKHGFERAEPLVAAESAWAEQSDTLARRTLYYQANSWFLGANVPGKPRLFLPYVGGLGRFGKHLTTVSDGGYQELIFD
jgi:cyclohexanone monooxygenase